MGGERRKGDVILCHNQLRDVFTEFGHHAEVRVKVGNGLTPDVTHSRSADARAILSVKEWPHTQKISMASNH